MTESASKMHARPPRGNCSNFVQKDARVQRPFHEVACGTGRNAIPQGVFSHAAVDPINAHNRRMSVVGAMTAVRARHLHHGRELVQSQRLHNATACRLQFEAAPLWPMSCERSRFGAGRAALAPSDGLAAAIPLARRFAGGMLQNEEGARDATNVGNDLGTALP